MILDEICNKCNQNLYIIRQDKIRYLRCDCGIILKLNVINATSYFENSKMIRDIRKRKL
jgi:hypothetical protein